MGSRSGGNPPVRFRQRRAAAEIRHRGSSVRLEDGQLGRRRQEQGSKVEASAPKLLKTCALAGACARKLLTCCGVQGPSCTLASLASLLPDARAANSREATRAAAAARGPMSIVLGDKEQQTQMPEGGRRLAATRARGRAGREASRRGRRTNRAFTGAHGCQEELFEAWDLRPLCQA